MNEKLHYPDIHTTISNDSAFAIANPFPRRTPKHPLKSKCFCYDDRKVAWKAMRNGSKYSFGGSDWFRAGCEDGEMCFTAWFCEDARFSLGLEIDHEGRITRESLYRLSGIWWDGTKWTTKRKATE